MTRYTVKQLAELARISVRALHHYDDIGLLKPAYLGDNGYRYYEQPQLYRLQQVMMYREFGLSLEEIRAILSAPDFDVATALQAHRVRLTDRLKSQQQMLSVIDETLKRMDGETGMTDKKLYIWQSEEKASEYKQWLMERYDAKIDQSIANVRDRLSAMAPEALKAIGAQREAIEGELAQAYRAGMDTETLAHSELLDRHRDWLAEIWGSPCTPSKYQGLADVYLGFSDYSANFEKLATGMTEWLAAGMKAWVKAQEEAWVLAQEEVGA